MTTKTTSVVQTRRWARGLVANSTASATPSVVKTKTQPVGDAGSFVIYPNGNMRLALAFFGTDTNNETLTYVVNGWSRYGPDDSTMLWAGHLLITGLATLTATPTGVAGGVQTNLEFDADTITRTGGALPSTDYVLYSPADDATPGLILLTNLCGFEIIQVGVKVGSAAACNAAWRWY